jgi:hypothetical protein
MQPPAMLSEHYEMLRAYVLGRNGSGPRLGQAVLMARGLAAWMEIVGELVRPVRSAPSGEAVSVSVPLLVQSDVIQLMGEAVMTLVCRGSL